MDRECRSVLLVFNKRISDGPDGCQSLFHFVAFALARLISCRHCTQNLLPVYFWIKRYLLWRRSGEWCLKQPLQIRLLAQHLLNEGNELAFLTLFQIFLYRLHKIVFLSSIIQDMALSYHEWIGASVFFHVQV